MRSANKTTAVALIIVAAYFLALVKDAFHAYFSLDDLMNLHRSWYYSTESLVRANVLFWQNSDFYRPMGSVFYRAIFHFAGFNPLPFHIVNLLFLLANIWLTYAVATRLSNSREIGAIAALLISYQLRFVSLYLDTGYIYDVLAYFFCFSCLLFYISLRTSALHPTLTGGAVEPVRQPHPSGWGGVPILSSTLCIILYIAALNSKEISATLPIVLLAYELLYNRNSRLREKHLLLAIWLVTLIFAIGHATQSGLVHMPAYHPIFTIDRLRETTTRFVADLFYRFTVPFSFVLVLWITLAAIAWITRQRVLQFAWIYLTVTPMPLLFIDPRGGAQYYVVLFGWVLYASAALIVVTKRFISERAVFVALAIILFLTFRNTAWRLDPGVSIYGERNRSIAAQMLALYPMLPPAANIVFIRPPFEHDQDALFLMRLLYRDRTIEVDRVQSAPTDTTPYDCILEYHDGHLSSTDTAIPSLHPVLISLYHDGWDPVTASNPIRPGEILIAKASGLGDTIPPVAPGKPFPADPLLPLAAPVRMRVNGAVARVEMKIGWPNEIGIYRLDFHVPQIEGPEARFEILIGRSVSPSLVLPLR